MDKTVPSGAALLLAFIGDIEAPKGYGTIYGNNQDKLVKPLTSLTVGDVVDAQATWTKRFKSSAAGRYQFMRATLQDLRMELGLRDGQIFDADLQDRLGYHLLKRRGYDEFMAGKISRTEFGKRLAQEWASLPVLATCQGAHVKLTRGQSYYCGDALNKSLVAPERVEAVLDKVKAAEGIATIDTLGGKSPEKPKPGPLAKSKRFWTWVMTGIGAPLAAFGALDWRVQFFIVAVIVGFAIYAISAMPQVRKALGLS